MSVYGKVKKLFSYDQMFVDFFFSYLIEWTLILVVHKQKKELRLQSLTCQ